jgi:hypothetical protein
VHAHLAKIVTEAGLEEGAGGGVERMAGRTEDIAYNAGDMGGSRWRGDAATNRGLSLSLLAFFAHFPAVGAGARGGCGKASRLAHDGVGDLVGFSFFGVVGIADGELGLDIAGAQELLHGLIPG